MTVTIEIEPTVLAEIKEQAKDWIDYETKLHERIIKEKRWDVADPKECDTRWDVCMGSIAHRIMEILYPEEYRKLMELISDTLNTVKQVTAQA